MHSIFLIKKKIDSLVSDEKQVKIGFCRIKEMKKRTHFKIENNFSLFLTNELTANFSFSETISLDTKSRANNFLNKFCLKLKYSYLVFYVILLY